VAIVLHLTQHQYQALALFLSALTAGQLKEQNTSLDCHTDKAEKLIQTN
jgi:hypothetical protein